MRSVQVAKPGIKCTNVVANHAVDLQVLCSLSLSLFRSHHSNSPPFLNEAASDRLFFFKSASVFFGIEDEEGRISLRRQGQFYRVIATGRSQFDSGSVANHSDNNNICCNNNSSFGNTPTFCDRFSHPRKDLLSSGWKEPMAWTIQT